MSLKKPLLLGAAMLLAFVLAGCNADCPSCNSLRNPGQTAPTVNTLAFDLCVSQVPEPDENELGCGSVSVEFVLVTL
jgi:hypothetical protein